ncbi:hypothetical protein, partial [Escherichia coli]|uniref:hypothetical protein n=1 Tax=Escherichia coli TaxID=562 RepID=UPI001BC881E1
NRLIRCVCGKKIGPDPRNFNQRVSLGRNDLLIRTFLKERFLEKMKGATVTNNRSRIARHCSHFKTEALLSWREVGMEFLITLE